MWTCAITCNKQRSGLLQVCESIEEGYVNKLHSITVALILAERISNEAVHMDESKNVARLTRPIAKHVI